MDFLEMQMQSGRGIPKEIGAFGERQFKETGASLVEVLRVKAVTLRKHFKDMRGVVFLVGVVSLDRVRVYFFTSTGIMVSGENIPHDAYAKVRKASRLLAKFEKPRELTPEEKRIEATEELRTDFGKAVKRVARYLNIKEPAFPDIFVTREPRDKTGQGFGMKWHSEREMSFNEDSLSSPWSESLLNRAAFTLTLSEGLHSSEFACCIGNALSLSLTKESKRNVWLEVWKSASKETEWFATVFHLIGHLDTYRSIHYNWLRAAMMDMKANSATEDFLRVLSVVHDSCLVSLGTEEYHKILDFCRVLNSPRKLAKIGHSLESIHLSPRVLVLPDTLGLTITEENQHTSPWGRVKFFDGGVLRELHIEEGGSEAINQIDYHLNIEDAYPSSGGLVAHGKSVVSRALRSLGLVKSPAVTYKASIERSSSTMNSAEQAVLERLSLGEPEILANTLVGSPQHVDSLVKNGRIVFLPDFNHLGIDPQYLIYGRYDSVVETAREYSLESTVFRIEDAAYALVCASGTWRAGFISSVISEGHKLWPVAEFSSSRRVIRHEPMDLL